MRSIRGSRYPERTAAGEPLPELERPPRTRRLVLRKGSVATRVLACIARAGVGALSARDITRDTKLKRVIVGTALNELAHNGMIERVNSAPPFLYRVLKR
jgi:hypothetical protein